jgi:serine/threonine-protein kinase
MGAVYRAERVPVGKLVAVKFLHASVAQDDEFQVRFERETHVMSKLAHPNCVSVLDFGVWEGAPYLVMDYVAGTTLREAMDHGPIPVTRALALARQIAAGLAHAHEQGVVHRDIKPANIMLTEEIGHGERVRILDFGLARLRASGEIESSSSAGARSSPLGVRSEIDRDATRTNMVVGTPNYMAPEQTVPGGSIDARADIYAVGIVLFEMIAGERPFVAEETLQLLGMHRLAPIPRLADRVGDRVSLVPGVQELIDKAMAKAPDARFQTALELAAALDAVIGAGSEPERDPTSPPKRSSFGALDDADPDTDAIARLRKRSIPAVVIAALAVAGGGAALAAYWIRRDPQPAAVATARMDAGLAASSHRAFDAATALRTKSVSGTADDAPNDAGRDARSDAPKEVPAGDVHAVVGANDARSASLDSDPGPTAGDDEEIAMDPESAVDLDPGQGSGATAQDEAENAPKTSDEVERNHAPPPSRTAGTLREAVQMVVSGQRESALASLRALRKRSPKSAYIPFLIGNLYFDQRWWSVAMDYYAEAIKKNARYRRNPTINRNIIKMLASSKTRQRASNFIRGSIGSPAAPHLRIAAAHGENPAVRKYAAALARVVR